jgi:hypothetical protein
VVRFKWGLLQAVTLVGAVAITAKVAIACFKKDGTTSKQLKLFYNAI